MPAIDNLVWEVATTTGTGNFTLSQVVQTFNEAFGTGGSDVFYYFIRNRDVAGEWEVGTGSMSDSTTLVRDTVLASSNSDALVSFSAGTKDVTNALPASNQVRIATGTYTGDGADSKAIAGVGFQPKYVRIWEQYTSETLTSVRTYETTDTIVDDNAAGMAFAIYDTSSTGRVQALTDRIIAIGSDGFTVDGDGTGGHPNTNAAIYNFLAIG